MRGRIWKILVARGHPSTLGHSVLSYFQVEGGCENHFNSVSFYACCQINPPGTKGFGTHTKHQGGGVEKDPPPVSQEREMLQT